MAKRIADDQITRENIHDKNSDDETNGGVAKPAMASSDVMSRRKIAMPKRKMTFTNRNNAATSESSFVNAFSFAKKPVPSRPKEKEEKLTALNLQFKDKIVNSVKTDPCVNLSTLFAKYESYISSINGVILPSTTSAAPIIKEKPVIPEKTSTVFMAPTLQNNNVEPENDESSSDEEVETKVEGPSFTIESNPIKSDSVFSFGKKKEEKPKDDSDSESDIEIKGPEFTFTGAVKSDVFKFSGKAASTEAKKPGFGQINDSNSNNLNETTNEAKSTPSFTFGTTKKAEAENEINATAAKPSFGIGTDAKTNPAVPAFTFGATPISSSQNGPSLFPNTSNTNETTTSTNKPGFTFGVKPVTTDGNEKEPEKPVFTFGNKPQQPAEAKLNKPKFAFGIPATTSEGIKEPTTKPSFTFGAKKETEGSTTKPSFTFGVNKKSSDKKEEESMTNAVPIFGSTNPEKPKFDFSAKSSEANNNEDKAKGSDAVKTPSFSFGTSTTTTNTPSFSFGKPAQANPFASTPAPNTASSSEKTSVPSGGFKFSLPFQQNNSGKESTAKTDDSLATEGDKQEATDVASDDGNKDAKDSSVQMQNGEENEDATFTQRAKLMVFNAETKTYDSRGVGEMKVLQKKDDKSKARLLCRSDGMGNVLLNTNIVKSFQYVPLTTDNENLIKTPVVDSDGKLVTYIVKFKMKADGRAFIKAISDCQKDLE